MYLNISVIFTHREGSSIISGSFLVIFATFCYGCDIIIDLSEDIVMFLKSYLSFIEFFVSCRIGWLPLYFIASPSCQGIFFNLCVSWLFLLLLFSSWFFLYING